MKHYRLLDELYIPLNRWFLGKINFDDKWDFWKYVTVGEVTVPKKELFVNIRQNGHPLDFTMADFELLIVNKRTATLFDSNDVQLFPVRIQNLPSKDTYFLMTLKNEHDCVDEKLSVFDKYQMDDPIRPDKAGEYKTIYKLVVRNDFKAANSIFRIKGYNGAIIISEELKDKLSNSKISGIKYQDTSGEE